MWARMNELEKMLNNMDIFRSRLGSAFQDFDRVAEQRHPWTTGDNYPRTNLNDTGDNLEVMVEVPGVSKDNINVKIQGNYLELSGKRTNDVPEGYTVHRTERDALSFSRSFTLPYEVNADNVEAALNNGILTMTLPKSEAAKPKQISIN